jgi:hypothetical protein
VGVFFVLLSVVAKEKLGKLDLSESFNFSE